MTLIKLTQGRGGKELIVNTEHILKVEADGSETRVYLRGDEKYGINVWESVREIYNMASKENNGETH